MPSQPFYLDGQDGRDRVELLNGRLSPTWPLVSSHVDGNGGGQASGAAAMCRRRVDPPWSGGELYSSMESAHTV